MAEWMTSSEEDLMSGDEELLMSGDEEDSTSSDGESEGYEQYQPYRKSVSTSIPVAAQMIKLITEETLLPAQREDLRRVMDILSVKEQVARTLLIHYRWDFESLFLAFGERGSDWLYSQAGVAIRPESTNSIVTICSVCTDEDLKEEDTTTMDCGHTFCNVCWTNHFLIRINEGQSKRIKCMAPECNVICDEDIIRKLVTAKDPEAAQRFDRFLFKSYIDDNQKVKWCPSVPNCGNAVRVEENVYREIQCTCGHQFCFSCLCQPHSPCSCIIWELWDKKCQDESETKNWIAVNTKSCPKCGKNVHKDGGCNLVSCVCGQYFCWLCGGATGREHTATNIDGHTCGRYKEDEEEDIEKAQRDLKRYTHYYSRWKAHSDSLKLEKKQKELLEKIILDLESKESGVSDYGWLTKALQRLFRARRALSYSYPFAFYMFGDDILRGILTTTEKELKQNLFEDRQQLLEGTVERLSKIIEGPFDRQSAMANRLQVIDLTFLADAYCRKMYEYIQDELLGKLLLTEHFIAPYNSDGVHMV